jgi:hypothetical protein
MEGRKNGLVMPNRSRRGLGGKIYGPDNVRMLQLSEERDFTNSSGWNSFVLVLQANLFQSNEASVGFVAGLVNDTIGAFTNLFELLVALQR